MKPPFKKILIANRGEIACRVIRSCQSLNITSAVIYSETDAQSLPVRLADEAYALGGRSPQESYLDLAKIRSALIESQADAVHPGYGFLSENPKFVELCDELGVTFIGPSIHAMTVMGDKIHSKAALAETDVPFLESHIIRPESDALPLAESIGYPILVKAAAGGGGKGMRIVRSAEELPAAITAAEREAKSAFGDGRLFMEKYLERPQHIEIQIMVDAHGQCITYPERECSIQRRHQKVVEESPSTHVSPTLRQRLQDIAQQVATAIAYRGAGTIEFLVDGEDCYFLEMNTRLQVEHPVTECVAGVDLVKQQILTANGQGLPAYRGPAAGQGHAIELRLYAEDPANHFFPMIGQVQDLQWPTGPGIRIDSYLTPGYEVTPDYDPMLAKIICWGDNREQALSRARDALDQLYIAGLKTNQQFLRELLSDAEFIAGLSHTSWLEKRYQDWQPAAYPELVSSPWFPSGNVSAYQADGNHAHIEKAVVTGPWEITAPLPGKIVELLVQEGDTVTAGQTLMTLEAMKMEHNLTAPGEGLIIGVTGQAGEQVALGQTLIEATEP